jgi:hypothetical protein
MKGGWAGAKVASASEEPGDARRTPVTSRRYGGERRPHPRGGGTGVTGAADRSAQRAVSRAESFALIQQRGLHEQLQRWTELARVLGARAICGAAAGT